MCLFLKPLGLSVWRLLYLSSSETGQRPLIESVRDALPAWSLLQMPLFYSITRTTLDFHVCSSFPLAHGASFFSCAPFSWCYFQPRLPHLSQLQSSVPCQPSLCVFGWPAAVYLSGTWSPTVPYRWCPQPPSVSSPIRSWRLLIHMFHTFSCTLSVSVYTISACTLHRAICCWIVSRAPLHRLKLGSSWLW